MHPTFSVLLAGVSFNLAFAAIHMRGMQEGEEGDENGTETEESDVVDDILFYLQYASIPLVSAIVGFFTNWVALKMTFYPTYYFGCYLFGKKYSRCKGEPVGCIGWQGIIPTKAGKMASMSVELMTTKVFDMKEIFGRIDRKKAAIHLKEGFETAVSGMIDTVADKFVLSKDTQWKKAQALIKQQLTQWALDELPSFAEGFMGDLVENLDDVYDLEDMCVTEMVAKPQILNDIFEGVGAKELRFIRDSGFYFGFLFGLVQLVVFIFFDEGYMLPIFGVFVGLATNYIALKMIFTPVEPIPVNFGCFKYTFHGLFLKRQKEASVAFARKIVGTVLHSENIWKHMLNGPKSGAFRELLDVHIENFTERMIGQAGPLVKMYLGEGDFDKMKEIVRQMSQDQIEEIIEYMHEYTDEALDLENEIGAKMGALPSKDFERVLHPVFEEDELKLVALGGVLGALVGLFQQFVIFGNN